MPGLITHAAPPRSWRYRSYPSPSSRRRRVSDLRIAAEIPRHSAAAGHSIECPGSSPTPRRLDLGDIDLTHLHHRVEGAFPILESPLKFRDTVPLPGIQSNARAHHPRRAASILAISILPISIIASKARFRS